MNPGLGVGGYCLTKDPKFLDYSSKNILKTNNQFPLIKKTISINSNMVNTSFKFIKDKIKIFKNKKILQVGISYKEDVDDLRFNPAVELAQKLIDKGVILDIYDPFFKNNNLPYSFVEKMNFSKYDIVIFCVGHKKIKRLNLKKYSQKTYLFLI